MGLSAGNLEGHTLYMPNLLLIAKSYLRGYLRSATTPVSISSMLKAQPFPHSSAVSHNMAATLVQELLTEGKGLPSTAVCHQATISSSPAWSQCSLSSSSQPVIPIDTAFLCTRLLFLLEWSTKAQANCGVHSATSHCCTVQPHTAAQCNLTLLHSSTSHCCTVQYTRPSRGLQLVGI
jgi:hypothetical protein